MMSIVRAVETNMQRYVFDLKLAGLYSYSVYGIDVGWLPVHKNARKRYPGEL